MIIDSHSHLHDEKFAHDLDDVLARAQAAKVTHMITIGCDIKTTERAARVAHAFANVFFTAGFHPHEAKFLDDGNLSALALLAQDKKCVAIGECGLDYYYEHSSKEEQRRAFERQLELAKKQSLPVVIHLRDAFSDCVAMLKAHAKENLRCVLHCFSGTVKEAKVFEELGCYISLSGIVTFKKPGELLDVAKAVSAHRLIIETDCPYLAPHPFRGQRNEPSFIVHTLEAVARARNVDRDVMAAQLFQNTFTFFDLINRIKGL